MSEITKIYEDATWGNTGKDIVPSRFYQAFRVEGPYLGGDDEGLWYEFDSEDKSTISLEPTYPNYEFNKYGKTKLEEEVTVTVTANSTLKGKYPLAIVRIDNKEYDLKVLDNPVKLFMNKDHKISIFWSSELVESFRVISLK